LDKLFPTAHIIVGVFIFLGTLVHVPFHSLWPIGSEMEHEPKPPKHTSGGTGNAERRFCFYWEKGNLTVRRKSSFVKLKKLVACA